MAGSHKREEEGKGPWRAEEGPARCHDWEDRQEGWQHRLKIIGSRGKKDNRGGGRNDPLGGGP